jgi:prevent-host-death family protein
MKTIAAGRFKAQCLALIEAVRSRREPLLITKRGKPVARLVPVEAPPGGELHPLRGTVLFERDIVSPTGVRWEAAR